MNENIESCQREKRTYDEEGVREAVRLFLKSIGEDPEREGLVETPDRIARACRELFAGLQASPADVLEKHFDVDTDELVLVKDIELYSVCEHHLLPFIGNLTTQGRSWRERSIARSQVLHINEPVRKHAPEIFDGLSDMDCTFAIFVDTG